MKTFLFICAFLLLAPGCFCRPKSTGDLNAHDSLYLGQIPPGDSAILFAPGSISLPNRRETKIVFSQNNMECLIGIGKNNRFQILYTDFYSGYWKAPAAAGFITIPGPIEPFFSADSHHVFLTSNANIFRAESVNQSWTTPVILGAPVSTGFEEYHPTTSRNGNLYFCSLREDGAFAIYRCIQENGTYTAPEKLPGVINCHNTDQDGAYDPFIAPDERYIIYSCIRSGGYGQADQYISFNRNGRWTNPKNLGPSVNTHAIEYGSYVSPDGKYYFFSRPAGWGPNAAADIYWIRIDSLINYLQYSNYVPYLNNPVPDQMDTLGHYFHFATPDSTFIDDDGNNTLTFSASLADGSPLPQWLVFDTISAIFSGVPTSTGILNLKVAATDPFGSAASAIFKLEVLKSNSIDLNIGPDISIFPNPTRGQVTISLGAFPEKPAIFELFNPEGRSLIKNTCKNEIIINLANRPKGVYLIDLTVEHQKIIRKICVE